MMTDRGGTNTTTDHDSRSLTNHSTETRRSVATSEFWVGFVSSILVLVAGYTDEALNVEHAWTLFSIITVAYLLSRGIAKAGSRESYVRPGAVDLR